MSLVIIFILICLLSFVVISVMLRPTEDQKALDRRLIVVQSQRAEAGAVSSDLEQYLKTRQAGSFGWIEDLIANLQIARHLRLLILQANSKTTLGTLIIRCLAGAVIAFLVAFFVGKMVPLALVAALLGSVAPIMALRMQRAKRLKAFNDNLADCIDMMSRSMRAGHSLPAAIGIVAEQSTEPVRSEFAEVSRQQNFGLPLRDAMNQLLDRIPSQDLRVMATGILVQKETGGNLAEVLDRIGAVIRDRVRIQGEIRTHTAQGRLTGWILCLLPIVMLVLINLLNPGYSTPLFENPTGQKILYIGVGLLAAGGFTIRKIINGIEM